jgi:hypothetical protein
MICLLKCELKAFQYIIVCSVCLFSEREAIDQRNKTIPHPEGINQKSTSVQQNACVRNKSVNLLAGGR